MIRSSVIKTGLAIAAGVTVVASGAVIGGAAADAQMSPAWEATQQRDANNMATSNASAIDAEKERKVKAKAAKKKAGPEACRGRTAGQGPGGGPRRARRHSRAEPGFGYDDVRRARLVGVAVRRPRSAVGPRVRLEQSRPQRKQRRPWDPAGAAGTQDGQPRIGLGDQRPHADRLGPGLHRRQLRQPQQRVGAFAELRLVLTSRPHIRRARRQTTPRQLHPCGDHAVSRGCPQAGSVEDASRRHGRVRLERRNRPELTHPAKTGSDRAQ